MEGLRGQASPGHTDGHMALVVGGSAQVTAGALPTREAAFTDVPQLVLGDPEAARRSVAELFRCGEVIIPGHDTPFWAPPALRSVGE